MDFSQIAKMVHKNALDKGWYIGKNCTDSIFVLARIALVHSELSEAAECARDEYYGDHETSGKPMGIASEFADAVIRIMDLCESLGIDLESAVLRKHRYNLTRTAMHGRKA